MMPWEEAPQIDPVMSEDCGAPNVTVEELRRIFLVTAAPALKAIPDVPTLELPNEEESESSDDSTQEAKLLAVHACPGSRPEMDVELWAEPSDRGHPADYWSVWWHVIDGNGNALVRLIDWCPFCGHHLYSDIDRDGFYRFFGYEHSDDVEVGHV